MLQACSNNQLALCERSTDTGSARVLLKAIPGSSGRHCIGGLSMMFLDVYEPTRSLCADSAARYLARTCLPMPPTSSLRCAC